MTSSSINERLRIIDVITDMLTPSINSNIKIAKKNAAIIKKKFSVLSDYDYIIPEDVTEGYIIRTVDLEAGHLSIPGIVVRIAKHSTIQNINTVKYFVLKNNYKNIYWKIRPQKYYLFKIEKGAKSDLRLTLERMLGDEIKKYKKTI